ncbi:MAG: prolipoprotein diacylglyceryl transferase, partial [Clostridia bacterium]|nr:prolipoprotein diacylglyceryl transferase [Clostridia bacterium]
AWYGIIITSAMLIGLLTAIRLARRVKIKSDDLLEMFLIAIPMAILFARLGYVIVRPYEYFVIQGFNFNDFINIFAIWDGGLTIISGAPGGILGAYLWSKWRKVDFLRLTDVIICVMLLSQGLGRWGNFFNQEIFGAAVTKESWQFFPAAVYIARLGGFYQATFFYEMVLDLLGFFALYFVSRRLLLRGSGVTLYAIAYGTIRFIMEFIRDEGELYEVVNFTQIICAVAVVAAATLLTLMILKEKKKGNRVWYAKTIPDKLMKPVKYAILKEGKTS